MSPSKLVRDRVPELWNGPESAASYRVANDGEIRSLLLEKLHEECAETAAEPSLEELADVVEVVRALAQDLGASWEDLERVRQEKAADVGAFAQRRVWSWDERPSR